MEYEPLATKEYKSGRELIEDYGKVHSKFFNLAAKEIAVQCTKDQGVIVQLHQRVARQLAEMTELLEQTHKYQAEIEKLKHGLSEKQKEVLRIEERMRKIEEAALKSNGALMDFQTIITAVAHVYHLTPQIIKGPCRDKQAVAARRHIIHLLTWWRPDLSLPIIGRLLGGRNHATILHARNTWWRYEAKFERQAREVSEILKLEYPVDSGHKLQTDQPDSPHSDKIAACG